MLTTRISIRLLDTILHVVLIAEAVVFILLNVTSLVISHGHDRAESICMIELYRVICLTVISS